MSGDFLVRQSLDGVGGMFRGDERRGGSAARDLARAADVSRKAKEEAAAAAATSVATAAKSVAKAEKEAEKELLRAADASRRLEKEATAKVAAAAKRLAKAEKKAEIDSLRAADTSRKAVKRAAVEIATATESVAQPKKEVIELGKRAKAAESSSNPIWGIGKARVPEASCLSFLRIMLALELLNLDYGLKFISIS